MTLSNVDSPKALISLILDCTVEAFNENHSTRKMDKDRFVKGDALYLETPPYKRFCEVCLALCAEIDEKETARHFAARWSIASEEYGTNWSMDAVRARIKKSLETNHSETLKVWDSIEAMVKRNGIELPELVVKTRDPVKQSSDLDVRGRWKRANGTPVTAPSKQSYFSIPPASTQFRPARDMNTAVSMMAPRAPGKPSAPRNAEFSDIISLSPMKIQEAMVRICADAGVGRAGMHEVMARGFATSETRNVRAWIAYVAERCLPRENYPLKRLASISNMQEVEAVRAIDTIRAKIKGKDADALRVLTAIPERLPLSKHQQKLLINPEQTRFKDWVALSETTTVPAEPRSPEGP